MSEMRELYQQVILDHYKRPRNYGPLPGANRTALGHNPLCGDKIRLHALVEDGKIADIAFEGSGCAISTAAASMMTESVKGKTTAEAEALFERFHDLVTGGAEAENADLGKLRVFSGVREYPVRVKCATLAWHTLLAALRGDQGTVATE